MTMLPNAATRTTTPEGLEHLGTARTGLGSTLPLRSVLRIAEVDRGGTSASVIVKSARRSPR